MNDNKKIAKNSLILYARLLIVSVCSLFTTKYALKALGVDDFGLFSVVGSVIVFMAIINTIMVSTSTRFITVALGKGDIEDANKQFNINLIIHIVIAIATVVIALPLGEIYIHKFINYNGDIHNAVMVFRISLIASAISFIGVPYNGLLMAKEKFIVFCSRDVFTAIIKLVVAILLVHYFDNKLLIYALTLGIVTAYPTVAFVIYCRKHYSEIVKFRLIRDKKRYKEVFTFSAWTAFGAIATIARQQGAALIVNSFFNTIMNTALGIANTVNVLITQFSQNISKPIAPQITKSYAVGDLKRCSTLMVMTSKYGFMLMLFISAAFLVEPEWILSLWLGDVPQYTVTFLMLMTIDSLIMSMNMGIAEVINAHGNIKLFQISINFFRLLSIVVAYLVLKAGSPPYSLFVVYIIFNIIIFFVRQWVLNKTVNFDNWILIKGAYIPSLIAFASLLPWILIDIPVSPVLTLVMMYTYLCIVILFIGLKKNERKNIFSFIQKQSYKFTARIFARNTKQK